MTKFQEKNPLLDVEQVLNALEPGRYLWLLSGFTGDVLEHRYDALIPEEEPYVFLTDEEVREIVRERGILILSATLTAFPAECPKERILAYGIPCALVESNGIGLHPLAEAAIGAGLHGGHEAVVFVTARDSDAEKLANRTRTEGAVPAGENKRGTRTEHVLLALMLVAFAAAALYTVAIVIVAETLHWEDSDGFLPWGVIGLSLLAASLLPLVLYGVIKLRQRTCFAKRRKRVPVKNLFGFLTERGCRVSSMRWAGMKRVSYLRGRFCLAVYEGNGRGDGDYCVLSFSGREEYSCFRPMSDWNIGTDEERRALREAAGTREELEQCAAFLKAHLSEFMSRAESDEPSGDAAPSADAGGLPGLPEEYFELEKEYEKRQRRYRILFTVFCGLIAFGGAILMILYIPLKGNLYTSLMTAAVLLVVWLAWACGGAVADRLSPKLRGIAERQMDLEDGLTEPPSPDPFDENKSPEAFRRVLNDYEPAKRPKRPPLFYAGAVVAALGAGAILASFIVVAFRAWLFTVLFCLGVWLTACGVLWSAWGRSVKAFAYPTLFLAVFGAPILIAYFIVRGAGEVEQAIGYAVSTVVGIVGLTAPILFLVVLPRRREAKAVKSLFDEYPPLVSEDGTMEYFYAGNGRIVWKQVSEREFTLTVERRTEQRFTVSHMETAVGRKQSLNRIAELLRLLEGESV